MQVLDSQAVIKAVVSSSGNMALAAERLGSSLGQRVTEYELITSLVSDPDANKVVAEQFRTLLTVKMYGLLASTFDEVASQIDELKPGELVRLHTSLLNSFATMTAPQAKSTFDVQDEARKAADELNLNAQEVEIELRQFLARQRQAVSK